MLSLQAGGYTETDVNGIPLLNHAEVAAIIDEGLEEFFQTELDQVVSIPPPLVTFSPFIPTA